MNVYVLGAGVSREVGYPLTRQLLSEIDEFSEQRSNSGMHIRYGDWPEHKTVLEKLSDPQVQLAYATGDLETLITLFDLAISQYKRSLDPGIQKEGRIALGLANRDETASLVELSALHKDLKEKGDVLRGIRRSLVSTLALYFDWRHHCDQSNCGNDAFGVLRKFARRLKRDRSVVITLNYDATIERVLMDAGLWTPTDGYGIPTLIVQNSRQLPSHSKVKVLKLHGSIGWYANQHQDGGKYPLRLSNAFLKRLGLWSRYPLRTHTLDHEDERAIILPTYLKNFDDPTHRVIMPEVWHQASDSLRRAKRVWILGYSLPAADTAVRTLVLSSIGRGRPGQRVKVINRDGATVKRISDFLGASPCKALTFGSWVQKGCP